MAEFERTTTIGMGADAAFALLADPRRLPEYAPGIQHVETTVVDGETDGDGEADNPGAAEARFFADGAARRVEWALPGTNYEGSIAVEPGTRSTSQVTIRLRTGRDDAPADVEGMIDDTIRRLRRLLSRR